MRIFLSSLCAFAIMVVCAMPIAEAAQTSPITAQKFVHAASVCNAFEIQSSKLALQKSQNDAVKRFAQRMIDDHTKLRNQLRETLRTTKSLNASMATNTLDNKRQKIFDKLQADSGKVFDQQFIADQTSGHKKAIVLFSDYAQYGKNAALRKLAQKALPELKAHLKDVKQLHS